MLIQEQHLCKIFIMIYDIFIMIFIMIYIMIFLVLYLISFPGDAWFSWSLRSTIEGQKSQADPTEYAEEHYRLKGIYLCP